MTCPSTKSDPAHTSFPDVMFIPAPFPVLGFERSYTGNLDAPKIIPADKELVRARLQNHDRVWIIQRRDDLYDPQSLIRDQIFLSRKIIGSYGSSGVSIDLLN